MDRETFLAYRENAPEIARRHRELDPVAGGPARYFQYAFPPGSRVLDLGSGSGRDLAQLVGEGHTAYGVEPAPEMKAEATRAYPELSDLVFEGSLPGDLPTVAPLKEPFDGILCSAVLQHLSRAELFDSVFEMRALLRPGGRVLVSIPTRRTDLVAGHRDAQGRLFELHSLGELCLLFERTGFREIERWEGRDGLGRAGTSWATFIFELGSAENGLSTRPLDRIEAVLCRDRKVSTYKLALLRALTDVAARRSREVKWRADGNVAIPIDAVSEQWISYYWALFESDLFLPQMNGEASAGRHKLGFSSQLDALRREYEQGGGLPAFLAEWRTGCFAPGGSGSSMRPILNPLLAKVKAAVRDGPVRYAGRSTEGEPLFAWDKDTADVLVPAPLWREISLMGHWIRDSLLVRWAEQSARFADAGYADAREKVKERALRVLLTPPTPERDTRLAREIFEAIPPAERRCAWTDQRIRKKFDVDHLIPFSLWQSNELWNLLPAAHRVNANKSDHLPERRLLRERRSAILECWAMLEEKHPQRFSAELSRLSGGDGGDPEVGFSALCEAIEVTAMQRGCERWYPKG